MDKVRVSGMEWKRQYIFSLSEVTAADENRFEFVKCLELGQRHI